MGKCQNWSKYEGFSKTCIPPEATFFLRVDGWKFGKISETLKTEKPFDERFAKCLVFSGKMLFEKGLNPALIYVASDELNVLFLDITPFRGRAEKIDSVLASLVSSVFTLSLQKFFSKENVAAFDSRIVIVPDHEKIVEYLVWRQMNAWRNHNNAYAYWALRKLGYKPLEVSKRLKGLKTEELHKILFRQGVDLAKTPPWQRRGILISKELVVRKIGNHLVKRWKIREDWNPPLFTTKQGAELIRQILDGYLGRFRD